MAAHRGRHIKCRRRISSSSTSGTNIERQTKPCTMSTFDCLYLPASASACICLSFLQQTFQALVLSCIHCRAFLQLLCFSMNMYNFFSLLLTVRFYHQIISLRMCFLLSVPLFSILPFCLYYYKQSSIHSFSLSSEATPHDRTCLVCRLYEDYLCSSP